MKLMTFVFATFALAFGLAAGWFGYRFPYWTFRHHTHPSSRYLIARLKLPALPGAS
jgi:hypothetical protein